MIHSLVDAVIGVAAILAILEYFGVKPKQFLGGWEMMALSRKWKLGIMLLLTFAALGMSAYNFYRSLHSPVVTKTVTVATPSSKWTMTNAQEQVIYGKHFFNQEVEVDGKKFDHCSFEAVTFIYHGTAPTDFVSSNFTVHPEEPIYLKTDNDAAKGYAIITAMLSSMPNVGKFFVGSLDQNGNITVINEVNKKSQNRKQQGVTQR